MRTILVATAIVCAIGLGSCSDASGPTEPTPRQISVVVAKPEPLAQASTSSAGWFWSRLCRRP